MRDICPKPWLPLGFSYPAAKSGCSPAPSGWQGGGGTYLDSGNSADFVVIASDSLYRMDGSFDRPVELTPIHRHTNNWERPEQACTEPQHGKVQGKHRSIAGILMGLAEPSQGNWLCTENQGICWTGEMEKM